MKKKKLIPFDPAKAIAGAKVNTRPMTRQELSDWLRECPEEHRECKYENGYSSVYTSYAYKEAEASKSVDDVLIRRNHGEWEKPLIEIND